MKAAVQDRDKAILNALDGIVRMQGTARCGLRDGLDPCVETGLIFIRGYYNVLPASITRRLTEISPITVANIPKAASFQGSSEERQTIALSVASDAAFAQAIRAANVYRKKLGLALLGDDGRPEETEGGSDEQQ